MIFIYDHLKQKKVKHISLKLKNIKLANNMKSKYGQDTEEKKKEEDLEAQDLTNDNEKRHDEEMKKAEDDKKDEEAQEDEDKEEAEDTDKLDLTDKQKEFLRDSKLAKQVAILKAEVKTLKAHIQKAKVEPIIDSILEAKSKLGKVNAEAEYAKLIKLDSSTLQSLKADYEQVVDTNNQPRYQVKYASVSNSDKTGDDVLRSIRGDLA